MKVLITGAGGFIGQTVTQHLVEQGHTVTAMVRNSAHISFGHKRIEWRKGDMRDKEFLFKITEHIDAVVHLASRKSDEPDSYESNVEGAKNLVQACERNGVRAIVNISTISTKLEDRGVYGETKYQADEILATSRVPVTTLKLSIVYGDLEHGIFGTLIRSTRLPVVPIIGPGSFTSQPIHIEDVAQAISLVLSHPPSTHITYDLGGPDLIGFNDLVRTIGKTIHGRRVILIHIPIFVGMFAARILKKIFNKPPITISNVMAMFQTAEVMPQDFFAKFDFTPRPLSDGLALMCQLTQQTQSESETLLRYIAPHAKIFKYQVVIYDQVIHQSGLHNHHVSRWILKKKIWIGGLDAITRMFWPQSDFQKKLNIAAALIESSPLSSEWLLPKKMSIARVIIRGSAAGLSSLGKLCVGVILACIPGLIKQNA